MAYLKALIQAFYFTHLGKPQETLHKIAGIQVIYPLNTKCITVVPSTLVTYPDVTRFWEWDSTHKNFITQKYSVPYFIPHLFLL
jgi:hypothetical protein